jgi:hypothetical protein
MAYTEKWIEEDQLLDYLSSMGAATIKEIKTAFNTNSKMTRLSLFTLGLTLDDEDSDEEYSLIVTGGKGMTTWWFLWPKHQRGKPNPMSLRRAAEVEARRRGLLRKPEPAAEDPKPAARKKPRTYVVVPEED